jgi:hypothetical protein
VILAGDVIETSSLARSSISGLLLGTATGVRYQNAAVLAVVAGGIFLWSDRRFWCAVLFSITASVPIALSAVINYERLNSWNPISKGPTYFRVPLVGDPTSTWLDPLVMFWARLGDYSYRPHLFGPNYEGWVTYDATTGAHLIFGFVLKKALLQSAPWAVLGLAGMCVAWLRRSDDVERRRRQIRLLSLVVLTMMAVFAVAGIHRDDGLSFNQRYFLELVPLLAVVFAWSLDRFKLPMRAVSLGCLFGAAIVLAVLTTMPMVPDPRVRLSMVRLYALLKVPLVLAAGLVVLWEVATFRARGLRSLAFWTGMCLGWAMMLHVGSDLVVAQALRRNHLERTENYERFLPDHSALVAFWGMKEPAGPLTLNRDLVIVDPKPDGGADAPVIVRELLEQKRRVFLLTDNMPPEIARRIIAGLHTLSVDGSDDSLLELKSE